MSIEEFTPGPDQFIPLDEAIKMASDYRANKEDVLLPQFKDILPLSETFNREFFDRVLGQPGCQGLRFYYSMKDNFKIHIITVGVNAANEDMIAEIPENTLLIENGIRCPIQCPPASVLNS